MPDWRSGVADWRVWALTLTIQWPGLRALARYAPWPSIVIPVFVTGIACVYAASLQKPRFLASPRLGSRRVVTVVITAIAAANFVIYPRVDSLKNQGRGSDEDDAVVVTAERLVTGKRPVYVPTYLGNPPFSGPGWALLVSPLAVGGAYALLTPIACAGLVWLVGRGGAGRSGR